MECARIREFLSEYIDGTLDAHTKALVEEHLKTCGECELELAALKALVKELGSLEHVEAQKDFLDKVHERIEQRSPFFGILRKLFVPARIKITLQFATVAATAVLVFAVFTMMQRPKQVADIPSASRQMRIAEKPSVDSDELASQKGSHELRSVLRKTSAPQGAREGKLIELVLLVKKGTSGEAHLPLPGIEVTETKKKARMIEGEERAIPSAQEDESAKQAAPEAQLSETWREQEMQPPALAKRGVSELKDEAVHLSPYAGEAISKVKDLIGLVEGKVLSEEYGMQTGSPHYITAKIPAKNYRSFVERLGGLGVLQPPAPDIPERDQDTVQIRTKLISSN
jgi:hypothetical protein